MNKVLKKIWDVFIYDGHLLAMGLAGTGIISALVLGVDVTWDFFIVVYAPTIAACLFGRYYGFADDALTNPVRHKHFEGKHNTLPYLIGILILIPLGILLYYEKYLALLFVVVLIMLSVSYELLFKNFTQTIIGFKNYYSSLLFTLISILLVLYYNVNITTPFVFILVYIYLMSFMSTSYSDLKDIGSDKKKGLKTIAVALGEKRLLLFQWVLSTVVALYLITSVYLGFLPKFTLALLFGVVYNYFVFILTARKNVGMDFMVDVVSDAQYLFWLFLIILGKYAIK